MKKSALLGVVFTLMFSSFALAAGPVAPTHVAHRSTSGENWKGSPYTNKFDFGVLTGMAIIDTSVGFALLGTFSHKIVNPGFAPDINDSVSVEFEGGPMFFSNSTPFGYSAHLRWDFHKDNQWTFYALGGLGGNITSSRFAIAPSFGVGAMVAVHDLFSLRGEISNQLIGVGVTAFF